MKQRTMRIPVEVRVVLTVLAAAAALRGEVDAREIIRRAVAANERNWLVARNYSAWERVDFRRLDSVGRLRSEEVRIYDVTLPEGSPYRRLVGRDDRPLTSLEEKKEREKFDNCIAERRKQTTVQKAQRVESYEQRPDWQRETWRELPEAFDFRVSGEEILDGHSVYVIDATPHPGYAPRSGTAKAFAHLRGKLWVDAREYQLVKAEAEVIDDVWMGLVLVRLSKGSRAVFEQVRVNDEVWLPLRLRASISARLALLKVLNFEHEVSYSRHYEFPAVSPISLRVTAR